MKKILLITRPIAPPWDEASKNFAYFLAKETKDFEFHVLTPGYVKDLENHIFQEPIYSSTHLDWKQRLKLFKLIFKMRQFEIAHFMLTPNKLNTWAFKAFLTNRRTKTMQTIATLREDLFSDQTLKKLMFADLIVTYSDYAKNKLHALGVRNVGRIYPGIDLQKYAPTEKNLQTMQLLGICHNDFIISYPGEYTRLGATDDLVNTLPDLFAKIPNAKFMFACRIKNEKDAAKKTEIEQILLKKGLQQRVIFTDTFTDMPKLYNISDIVAFPVRDMKGKFDVPLAVIEAMACEKPVIISDLPILQEFTNSENAAIVKTGDMQEFVSICVDLWQNKTKRENIGKLARKYTQENFDIQHVVTQYQAAYKSLLS